MAQPVTIKKGPIAIVKNLIALQLLAVISHSAFAVLADYGKLYRSLTISQVISYELAKVLFISIAELILTVYIFIRWFNENYTILGNTLVHERGVFFGRQTTYELPSAVRVAIHTSPISRLFKYGSLIVRNSDGSPIVVLHDVSQPERFVPVLEGRRDHRSEVVWPNRAMITDLISRHEHEQLEKKSSFRWDFHIQKVNADLEHAVMKTIAAFLNSEGGRVIIGVDDHGQPLGLEHDYRTLRRPDADSFENHLTQIFNRMIGADSRRLIRVSFPQVSEVTICLVEVARSPKPVYVKGNTGEAFYIRTGNTTTPLKLSEATAYIQSW